MLELRPITTAAILFRILASVLLGGVIGLERGMKHRPAGLRTYILVCIGSCVVMMMNQYVYQVYHVGDPVRLGAQVISGIGFLGTGTIIVTSHNQIKGLTTAAGLWACASIGLTIGIGLYEVAVVAGVSVYAVLNLLYKWDYAMRNKNQIVDVYVELAESGTVGSMIRSARENNLELSNLEKENDNLRIWEGLSFIVTVQSSEEMSPNQILRTIQKFDSVKYAELL